VRRLIITQRTVVKLAAPTADRRQTIYWDDQLRGFGAQCSGKTSQRLYIIQRDVNGKSRRITLGTVSGLKLDAARRRAEDVLDDLRREKGHSSAGGGNEAKRAFVLPMSIFVHELLVRRRAAGMAGPFVFPGPGKVGHITSADRPLHDVARDTGIEVSCHDLRRTFASVAADTPEVSWLALKLMLNHRTRGDVTAGYVLISTEQLRAAVQRVADKMLALCDVQHIAEGNVARLR
jgi:integrase